MFRSNLGSDLVIIRFSNVEILNFINFKNSKII